MGAVAALRSECRLVRTTSVSCEHWETIKPSDEHLLQRHLAPESSR